MLPPAASIAVMAEEEAWETVIFTGVLKVAAPCLQPGSLRKGLKRRGELIRAYITKKLEAVFYAVDTA